MSNLLDLSMAKKVSKIIEHLKTESAFLDGVIKSSLAIQTAIRRHREAPIQPMAVVSKEDSNGKLNLAEITPIQAERNRRLNDVLSEIRAGIAISSSQTLACRKKLVELLKAIEPNQLRTPTLGELAQNVEEPRRTELKELRTEIKTKLAKVHSISMGNQAVLIYTLDFYDRLLRGCTGEQQKSNYYNAAGHSESKILCNLIKANC